jgi:hypothetical protein
MPKKMVVPTSRGGLGLEAGTCSLGKSESRLSTPVYIVTVPFSSRRRSAAWRPQKAMMSLRMVWSSGWGLWGEVGDRPNGPSFGRGAQSWGRCFFRMPSDHLMACIH